MENDSSLVSAPTSPSRCSLNTLYFYSAPSSPTRGILNSPFGSESEQRMPQTNEDVNSYLKDFEFETSQNFDLDHIEFETSQNFQYLSDNQEHQHKERQRGESFPSMAFADELFCNGQVLPLKLPPRLQNVNDIKCSNQSSTASSPRSPSSVLKIPFKRRSMWNDNFDPFMAALENVKEEHRGKSHGKHHRRTRSISPLRTTNLQWSNDSRGCNPHQSKQVDPLNPMQKLGQSPNEPMEPKGSAYTKSIPRRNKQMDLRKPFQVGPSPNEPAEPNESTSARKARPVKMGHEKPIKPTLEPLPGPTLKTGECAKESGESSAMETRGQRMKRFLLRRASFRREYNEDKQRDQTAALWKPQYFRRFSFKSMGAAQCNGKERVFGETKMAKMALIQYRPRLFLCLGFGIKGQRNMN